MEFKSFSLPKPDLIFPAGDEVTVDHEIMDQVVAEVMKSKKWDHIYVSTPKTENNPLDNMWKETLAEQDKQFIETVKHYAKPADPIKKLDYGSFKQEYQGSFDAQANTAYFNKKTLRDVLKFATDGQDKTPFVRRDDVSNQVENDAIKKADKSVIELLLETIVAGTSDLNNDSGFTEYGDNNESRLQHLLDSTTVVGQPLVSMFNDYLPSSYVHWQRISVDTYMDQKLRLEQYGSVAFHTVLKTAAPIDYAAALNEGKLNAVVYAIPMPNNAHFLLAGLLRIGERIWSTCSNLLTEMAQAAYAKAGPLQKPDNSGEPWSNLTNAFVSNSERVGKWMMEGDNLAKITLAYGGVVYRYGTACRNKDNAFEVYRLALSAGGHGIPVRPAESILGKIAVHSNMYAIPALRGHSRLIDSVRAAEKEPLPGQEIDPSSGDDRTVATLLAKVDVHSLPETARQAIVLLSKFCLDLQFQNRKSAEEAKKLITEAKNLSKVELAEVATLKDKLQRMHQKFSDHYYQRAEDLEKQVLHLTEKLAGMEKARASYGNVVAAKHDKVFKTRKIVKPVKPTEDPA